jgi:hypothetical protein
LRGGARISLQHNPRFYRRPPYYMIKGLPIAIRGKHFYQLVPALRSGLVSGWNYLHSGNKSRTKSWHHFEVYCFQSLPSCPGSLICVARCCSSPFEVNSAKRAYALNALKQKPGQKIAEVDKLQTAESGEIPFPGMAPASKRHRGSRSLRQTCQKIPKMNAGQLGSSTGRCSALSRKNRGSKQPCWHGEYITS